MADSKSSTDAKMDQLTCSAPINIAVIKYWGKRDEHLVPPINNSISITLSKHELHTKTSICIRADLTDSRIWVNGKEESFAGNKRIQNLLAEIRQRQKDKTAVSGEHVHICSENNFPTAAGLASSASGYACLVYTLCQLYGINGNVSDIARLGSGSACRSMFGGFVRWNQGSAADGSDSLASQIADEHHWSDLRVLVCVASEAQKPISSTSGMQQTVKTSEFLKYRAEHIVPDRMTKITDAILRKDFATFADITMKDSNQLHACCLDTWPPIIYLNKTSYGIIKMVHRYNEFCGETRLAYTFDAGPNACLFTLDEYLPEIISLLFVCFPPSSSSEEKYIRGIVPHSRATLSQECVDHVNVTPQMDGIQYIISTRVGSGPHVLEDPAHCLFDESFGPK